VPAGDVLSSPASSHSHSHSHSHDHAIATARLPLAIGVTVLFVMGEAIAGLLANSVALLADAAHNSTDVLSLGLSAFAVWISKRPGNARRTFGYHRSGVLAALVNALTLVSIGAVIIWEGLVHLVHPQPMRPIIVIVASLVAVAVNLLIGFWLHGGKSDLNLRAAYLHQLGDAASALGVAVAGGITLLTGMLWPDGVASLLIGLVIIWSAWAVLRESISILLESSPRHIDMLEVERSVLDTPGVTGIHDLHLWTIASGMLACSCHVVVAEQSVREGQEILRAVQGVLRQKFGVRHTTVQIEVEGCEPDELYCGMPAEQHQRRDHQEREEHP
jgi:cobalt-zinc-cadmium efflux system protein